MYRNEVSTPIALVGTLAMTGPDSVVTWVVAAAVSMGAGAFLLWRQRLLRHAVPDPRGRRDRCR
jgi:LPXTG-motif cell wall-anchored protein